MDTTFLRRCIASLTAHDHGENEARDWERLPERFRREIEREHVVLVGGEDAVMVQVCGDGASLW